MGAVRRAGSVARRRARVPGGEGAGRGASRMPRAGGGGSPPLVEELQPATSNAKLATPSKNLGKGTDMSMGPTLATFRGDANCIPDSPAPRPRVFRSLCPE